jgi:hypothetical protein
MDALTNLLPTTKRLGNKRAEEILSGFRTALETGDESRLPDGLRDQAVRIAQASEKIAAESEIALISELMTLAQFGAGSLGAAVADAFDDLGAAPALEALLISRFLIEVVFAAKQSPFLLPGDLLRQNEIDRATLAWPEAEPVFSVLIERAGRALDAASTGRVTIASHTLRKLFDREHVTIGRQIRKLAGKNPNSPRTRLTALDRIIISLTIRLHLRATP